MSLKTETIRFRVEEETKNYLQSVADLKDENLSKFILDSAIAKAKEIERQNKIIELEEEQFSQFMNLLDKQSNENIGDSYKGLDFSNI